MKILMEISIYYQLMFRFKNKQNLNRLKINWFMTVKIQQFWM